jgi:beta-glucanase (GH16 family)
MTKIPIKRRSIPSGMFRVWDLGFASDFGLRISDLCRLMFVVAICAISISAAPATQPVPWKLVWSDEFDTPGSPDARYWSYESGYVRNNEKQYYSLNRPENVRVEDGHLIIEARADSLHLPTGKTAKITSGAIETPNKASWKYGRIEVRAKIPEGRGTWPAIWMMPDDQSAGWPACGEIDIMESVGFEPDVIHQTIHTRAGSTLNNKQHFTVTPVKDLPADFHIYAMQWDSNEMEMFIDGRETFTFINPHTGADAWPFDKPFHVILNLAIGGAWGGIKGIDDSMFPCRMDVDYVRAYQREQSN